jgi:hypothetical protein
MYSFQDGRVPAQKVQGPEFKFQNYQKKKKSL